MSLVAAMLALRVGFAINGRIDADESQHLHAAWLVGQGQVPYRDFWEHHSPLAYCALAPLTRVYADSPRVYLAGRVAMIAVAIVMSALLYRLGRRFGHAIGFVAVLVVSLQPRVIQYTTQVRPDVPALAAWIATLLALIRWREASGSAWMWATGLLLGTTAAFSPKAAYGFVGVAVLVVVVEVRRRARPSRIAGCLVRLAVGAAIPMLVVVAWLGTIGGLPALHAFVQYVVLDNLAFSDPSRRMPFSGEAIVFLVLAIVGVVATVRRLRLGVVDHSVHGPLIVPTLVVAALLSSPRTPAVYEYTWLPVVIVAAIYAACAIETAARHATTSRRAALGLGAIVALGFMLPAGIAVASAVIEENRAQLRRMEFELAYACPGEPVLDGTGLYVFRPAAMRYAALVVGIRRWIGVGRISSAALVDELRRSAPPVGLRDTRIRIVGGAITAFADRYYVRRPDGLLLAGAAVTVDGTDSGRASIELIRSTIYRVTTPPGGAVAIDGVDVSPGLVSLTEGAHVVTWSNRTRGTIEITAGTCAERSASHAGAA